MIMMLNGVAHIAFGDPPVSEEQELDCDPGTAVGDSCDELDPSKEGKPDETVRPVTENQESVLPITANVELPNNI